MAAQLLRAARNQQLGLGPTARQGVANPFALVRTRRALFATRYTYAALPSFDLKPADWERKWVARWDATRAQTMPQAPPSTTTPASQSSRAPQHSSDAIYLLAMFPYPSGWLHMGHVRVYTISDTLARVHRMQGKTVIHPMGWDAFGLPAENAAIERGVQPAQWTATNIAHMKQQLRTILVDMDWDREFATSDPSYYKWTQDLFLQLYGAGLVYQKEALVNWDPIDQTVLANEQVDKNGRSWRSGAVVEQRRLRQWFIKITKYADDLLRDLDLLPGWPQRVKQMQRNWIGKSTGAEFDFALDLATGSYNSQPSPAASHLTVFTSRPDTLYGVTYLAISTDHPLASSPHIPHSHRPSVEAYTTWHRHTTADQAAEPTKEGIATGLYARHPFTGDRIPIYVAAYVLSEYGTGVVMGVPAHDTRDWEFAHANAIPNAIRHVVDPPTASTSQRHTPQEPVTALGQLNALNGPYAGLSSREAQLAIVRDAAAQGFGRTKIQYKLRDWLVSRQRFWGAPVPMVHCDSCGVVPVPRKDLPVRLPDNFQIDQKGGSPLQRAHDWLHTPCPQCQKPARRETDTMDTFVDSSWYYLRFLDPRNATRSFTPADVHRHMPVDLYIGGIEHAILHLLYARFISKFLWKEGHLALPSPHPRPTPSPLDRQRGEPFTQLLTQGMVHGQTFKDSDTGQYLKPDEVDRSLSHQEPIVRRSGKPALVNQEKMSKSKYNGVDPQDIVRQYGADCTRLYILYKAPPQDVLEWDDQSIVGMQRWLIRVGRLVAFVQDQQANMKPTSLSLIADYQQLRTTNNSQWSSSDRKIYHLTHQTIQQVTQDMTKHHAFNTAIAGLIKLTNALVQHVQQWSPSSPPSSGFVLIVAHALAQLLRLMAPMAPCTAEELWSRLITPASGNTIYDPATSVFSQPWPQLDPHALQDPTTVCVVQINGKTRFKTAIATELLGNEAQLIPLLQADPSYVKWTMDRTSGQSKAVLKTIVVQGGKLVNFIIK
ncbi:Leucyl-tRNA synthetase, mitochondrial [Dimargaris xerosporica]|nr:Leucyl-tRNA synthetase, mitochondrial [Dimargaris xerosporica]